MNLINTSISGSIENFNNYVGGVVGQSLTYSTYSQVKCDVDITLKNNQPFPLLAVLSAMRKIAFISTILTQRELLKCNKAYNAADGDNNVGGFIGLHLKLMSMIVMQMSTSRLVLQKFVERWLEVHGDSFQSNRLFSFGGYCNDPVLNYVGSGTGGGQGSFYVKDDTGSCFVDANNGIVVTKCADVTQAEMVGILNDPDKIFSDDAVLGVSLGWDPTIWKIINGGLQN